MAVVGDATIIVRAITDKVKDDILKGMKGLDKVGNKAGEQFGESFLEGFSDKLDEDLGDTLDKAFKDAVDSATNAGKDSSREFVNGFSDGIDTELTNALNKALSSVDSSAAGEKIGKDLNAGIMRGLGNKDEEIGNLLDRAGESSADRFNSAFADSGNQIARSLEDSLNNIDLSGLRDNIGNQLAEALIPIAQRVGEEMGLDLVDGIGRGARRGGGGGLGDLISFDPSDFVSDVTERISSDVQRDLDREMRGVDLDLNRVVVVGGDGLSKDILDPIYKMQREARPVVDDMGTRLNRLFSGGGGDGGLKLSTRFANFAREARAASKTFTTLYGVGQLIGPALGVAAGGISTLVTGAFELGSAIAEAIPAGVAVASKSLSALVQGFATIKVATIGFSKVFKDGLKAATIGETKGFGSNEYIAANEKYLESLSQLAPEAQSFLKYIISLRKEGIKLRNAAGKGLFPALESSVKRLNKALFPTLLKMFEETGTAVGSIATEVSKAMSTESFVKNFGKVAKTNNEIITISGKIFANLIDIINALLVAAGPVTKRFFEWVKGLTDTWKAAVNADGAIEKLTDKFNKSGDIAAQLGRIFGNIGRGIVAIGTAAAPAGEKLLTAFEGATKKFEEFGKSLEGNPKAAKFFDDVADNVIAIGRLFNSLVIEFAKLGDNKAIAETADKLGPLVPIIGDILDSLTEAGPQLADLLESLSETFKLLTDSKSIQTFLDTLNLLVTALNDVLSTEFGQKMLLWVGPIIAVHRALSFAWNIARFFFLALAGGPLAAIDGVKKIGAAFQTLRIIIGFGVIPTIQAMGAALAAAFAANPVGVVIVAIAAVVAALAAFFTWLYKNNEGFKRWVDGVWSAIKGAAVKIGDFFKGLWDTISEGWSGLVDAFSGVWDSITGAISTAFDTIKAVLEPFIVFFVGYWSIIINIVKGAVTIFLAIFKPLLNILIGWWKVLGTVFIEGAKAVWSIFKTLADFIWSIVTTLFGALRTIFMTVFVILYTPVKIAIGLAILAFKFLYEKISGYISAAIAIIKAVWGALKSVFGGPVNDALAIVRTVFDAINIKIREVVNGIVAWIKPKLETIGSIFKTVFDGIKKVASTVFDGIKGGIETGIDKVKGFINGFISTANKLIRGVNTVTEAVNTLPGVDIPKIPEIPKLASGGIVYPSSGGTLALLAEAGRPERVEPLDGAGMSARDRLILEAIKNSSGKEVHVTVNNYYPEPERASENLAMSMRVAREHMAGV